MYQLPPIVDYARSSLEIIPPSIRNFPWGLIFPYTVWSAFFLVLIAYLFLEFVATEPRPARPTEKVFKTVGQDGKVSEPQPLPCWYDAMIAKWKKAQKEAEAEQGTHDFEMEKTIEAPELFMTVVIPAFNEEKRLLGMLEEAVNYLQTEYGSAAPQATKKETTPNSGQRANEPALRQRANGQVKSKAQEKSPSLSGWEILMIDDGSRDSTVNTALDFAQTHQLPARPRRQSGPWTHRADRAVNIDAGSIRVVSLTQNRGKGGAVTHGMRHARGQYVVFADADGASKFDDLGKLVSACQKIEDAEGRGVAVGSRAHLVGSEAVVKRSKMRNFLMHSFHLLLRLLTPRKTATIKDTQCGFKLFSRPSLPYIVPFMHSEGWIFDVEMLMLAEFSNIPVVEVPIGWREVMGSKLNVMWDSFGMAYSLALLRFCWSTGAYRRG